MNKLEIEKRLVEIRKEIKDIDMILEGESTKFGLIGK